MHTKTTAGDANIESKSKWQAASNYKSSAVSSAKLGVDKFFSKFSFRHSLVLHFSSSRSCRLIMFFITLKYFCACSILFIRFIQPWELYQCPSDFTDAQIPASCWFVFLFLGPKFWTCASCENCCDMYLRSYLLNETRVLVECFQRLLKKKKKIVNWSGGLRKREVVLLSLEHLIDC